ncbi:MAG TPA: hypothetical protein VGR43_07820 [Dehalococcoidia bacterium]|nr:hypothetical protein [Dehalococcoidia bacterium]
MRLAFLALIASVVLILIASCGDDAKEGAGGSPTGSVTPADGTPAPPPPELAEGVSRLSEGTFTATIDPEGVSAFEPIALPLELGAETPPCESFVFVFGWQVVEPIPIEDAGLVWSVTRMGAAEEIARGASGTATVGCGFLEAVNHGDARMTLNVHYLIGRSDQ